MNSAIQDARAATSRLVRLLGGTPESPAPGRPLLENAKKDAKENDEAEEKRFVAKYDPYWRANLHDAAYWREVLKGKVSEATIEELLRSMGLL